MLSRRHRLGTSNDTKARAGTATRARARAAVRVWGTTALTVALLTPAAVATADPFGAAAETARRTAAAQPRVAGVLPLDDYSDMVVDGVHSRLFLSDPTRGAVVVTDFDGAVLKQVTGLPGAAQLALSKDTATLYAALPGADTVAAISTTTHEVVARYATGAGTAPRTLAVSGERLWFGYGSEGAGDIGSLDLTTARPVVTLGQATADHWYSAPALATSADAPGVLVAGDRDVGPATFAVYDVHTATARRTAERRLQDAGGTRDLTFTADGKNIIVASGSPYYHQVLRTSDLADAGHYPAAAYPNAVAVAADGAVAAGVDSAHGSDVFVFEPGARTSHGVFEFASGDSSPLLLPAGLGWAPDNRHLFAVTRETRQGAPVVLRVLTTPDKAATETVLHIPSTTPSGARSLTGRLASDLPFPAGTAVTLTRLNPGTAKPVTLPSTTLAADETFALTDRATVHGYITYTASFAGDALHLPSSTSIEVHIP
ncbi:YncE family protein [Streptomyces sp. NPDC086838]|uniref:YncE family protein n=1 Tax=Streptomyces sp. NPDC086838 TaxID=3365762 RepID=UPI00382AF03D